MIFVQIYKLDFNLKENVHFKAFIRQRSENL